jgi:hypothetical protein
VALIEIFFGLQEHYDGGEYITMFLFVGTIIVFGYLLEINFVDKGVEAYGINEPKIIKRRRRKIIVNNANEEVPKNIRRNITSYQLSLF